MNFLPKLRKAFRVSGDPDNISRDLASGLPHQGVTIQQHHPGSRICGSVFRPLSLTGGQKLKIDLHPLDNGQVEAVVESKFRFLGFDFTHENEKNITLVEGLLGGA